MNTVVKTLLTPLRPLHSPLARRAYITLSLFSISASTLLFLATISYIIFYINYIPNITVAKDVYLTYPAPYPGLAGIPYALGSSAGVVVSLGAGGVGSGRDGYSEGGGGRIGETFPNGIVELNLGDLIPRQDYDVQVELHLPTSPLNRDLGNFMVELELWSPPIILPTPPSTTAGGATPTPPPPPQVQEATQQLLYKSLRPAILTYHSSLPTLLSTLLKSPLLLTHLSLESESLTIPLLNKISFPTKPQTPQSVKVTLRAPGVQTYSVRVKFKARLGGLRNLMYSYRLLSASVFISIFWVIELVFAMGVWWVLIAKRDGAALPFIMPGDGSGGNAGAQVAQGSLSSTGAGAGAAAGGAGAGTIDTAPNMEDEEDEDAEISPVGGRPQTPSRITGPSGGGSGSRPRTPGAAGFGRSYLPSPSPTPQPEIIPEPVREGYAPDEETDTEASTIGDVEEEEDEESRRGGLTRSGPGRRIRPMVEDNETDTTDDVISQEEEGAVLVSGGGRSSRAGGGPRDEDSGIGAGLYDTSASAATGREHRRGSSGSGTGTGGSMRRR